MQLKGNIISTSKTVAWRLTNRKPRMYVVYDPCVFSAGHLPHQVGLFQTSPVCWCSTVWWLLLISLVLCPLAFFSNYTQSFYLAAADSLQKNTGRNILQQIILLSLWGLYLLGIHSFFALFLFNIIAYFIPASPLPVRHLPLPPFYTSLDLCYVKQTVS